MFCGYSIELLSGGSRKSICGCTPMWSKDTQHPQGARCSSVVRAFDNGVMGRRINPSWGGPIELFLVPPSAPRLVCGMCYPVCGMMHI